VAAYIGSVMNNRVSTVTLVNTNYMLPDDSVTVTPKHVGAVLMQILM